MRITFVLPYAGLDGGIKVVAIYASLLQQRGHEVFVVSTPMSPLPWRRKIKTWLRERRWPKPVTSPSHFDELTVPHRVIERSRPIRNEDVPDADVIIATWWETAEWIESFAPSKGDKFYFIQGYEARSDQPLQRVRATYRLPYTKITISIWLQHKLMNEAGDRQISLVPNGVDHRFFDAPEDRGKQLRPTIGFVYSPILCKGCDIVLAALNKVAAAVPALRILAFGTTLPQEGYPLPPQTEYQCRPAQQDIRSIYSTCDYWLFGSREEGFGLPILEAMACRTPVIASTAGAAPELLADGGGRLIAENTPENLAKTILECLALSNESWQELSRRARATAIQYSWDEAVILFEQTLLAPTARSAAAQQAGDRR